MTCTSSAVKALVNPRAFLFWVTLFAGFLYFRFVRRGRCGVGPPARPTAARFCAACSVLAHALRRSSGRQCVAVPAARSGSRGRSANGRGPFHTGALIATFRCAAPARCGAFAHERRVVAGDEGVWVLTSMPVPGLASFAAGVAVWNVGGGCSDCEKGERCFRASQVAAAGSRFPPYDPVRAGGADNSPFAPACASATFRCAAPALRRVRR